MGSLENAQALADCNPGRLRVMPDVGGCPACSGNVCTIPDGAKWSGRAAARCRDCVSPAANLCEAPPRLLVHQYLHALDAQDWRGNLLSLQAYLLTQVPPLCQGDPWGACKLEHAHAIL